MTVQATIEEAWETRDTINASTQGKVRDAVNEILTGLDNGSLRVADKHAGVWQVNQWVKKAILLSFRLNDMALVANAPAYHGTHCNWFDKVPSKFQGWGDEQFRAAK